MLISTSLLLLAAAAGVHAHGKLASINGANGVTANGLAIVPGTPGTGSTRVTEADTTIFGAKANRNAASVSGCGKTPGGGVTDCATAAAQSLATAGGKVPTANSDGTVDLTFHQVNQDGAGPLAAMVSGDMGKTWQAATVQENAGGFFGLSGAANEDIPVKVQVPAGTSCAGTAGTATGVCLVALANPIQGFGGAAPFQMANAAPVAASPAAAVSPAAEPAALQIRAFLHKRHARDFRTAEAYTANDARTTTFIASTPMVGLRQSNEDTIRTEQEAILTAIVGPTVATCQALILLAIKAHRTVQHSKSWHLLGLACRSIQSLGFHRDRAADDPAAQQIQRRVFWTAYILDKLMGVEFGRPWMLRRADSDAKLISEGELEEFEVISAMFRSDGQPGAGRVLSTFNSQCRLAVIYEKVMDMRTTFASASERASAIEIIDRVCQRWRKTLQPHLELGSSTVQQPMMVHALHALYYSCVSLLYISSAEDAVKAGKTVETDSSLARLSEISAAWLAMIGEATHHFIYSVQCARPLSFPPLLLASINNLVATPAMLGANQRILKELIAHRDGGRVFDSRGSLLHVIQSISALIPTAPADPLDVQDNQFQQQDSHLPSEPLLDLNVDEGLEAALDPPAYPHDGYGWSAWGGDSQIPEQSYIA